MKMDFYIGVKAVIRAGDQVLVLQKNDPDGFSFWDVPGGRIEDDDSIEETLVREVAEEVPSLGAFENPELIHAFRIGRNPGGKGLVLLFYRIDVAPFEVAMSTEHVAYRWVSKETLLELTETLGIKLDPGTHTALQKALG